MSLSSESEMPRAEWLSAHIFFNGDAREAGDQVVLGVIAPLSEQLAREHLVDSHFFIRYSEHGQHVRLRVKPRNREARECLLKRLPESIGAMLPREIAGTPRSDLPDGASRTRHPAVIWIPYEPEVHRYGGTAAVTISEHLFCASSRFAQDSLFVTIPFANRLGLALAVAVVTLSVLLRDTAQAQEVCRLHLSQWAPRDATQFLQRCHFSYERQSSMFQSHVKHVWQWASQAVPEETSLASLRLSISEAGEAIERLRKSNRVHARPRFGDPRLNVMAHLIPSWLHMTNNRLGIWPAEEAFLAYCINESLGTIDVNAC